jgi:hypothetical protein
MPAGFSSLAAPPVALPDSETHRRCAVAVFLLIPVISAGSPGYRMPRARLWTCQMFFHSQAQGVINPPASSPVISRLAIIHSAFLFTLHSETI